MAPFLDASWEGPGVVCGWVWEPKRLDFGIQNGIQNGARRKSAVINEIKEHQLFFLIFPWFEGYPLKIGSKSGSLSDPRRTPPKVRFMLIYVEN